MNNHSSLQGSNPSKLTAAGLFAGIGGVELGFAKSGIATELLCEIDPSAQTVLKREFPSIPIASDILKLKALPKVDIVAGGFPCQNLSLVGDNTGIFGAQSGLISEVFRLVKSKRNSPKWLILENVPFMLWHQKGHAVRHVTQSLSEMGFRWAYRVVDARSFGLPQRRRRVIFVASRTEDPCSVLFCDDAGDRALPDDGKVSCGFYWTEGRGGLGWAVNGVPTLKGGSSIGIPSPPAIWDRSGDRLVTPDIRDAERMQGFRADWTDVELEDKPLRVGHRWKLVGNAVSVNMAEWLGNRLINPGSFDRSFNKQEWLGRTWPDAAYGEGSKVYEVAISDFPEHQSYQSLDEFLKYPLKLLSAKATNGFLSRAKSGKLRFAEGFLDAAERHLSNVS